MSKASEQFLKNLSVVMSLLGLAINEDRVCCLSDPGALDIQMEWIPEPVAVQTQAVLIFKIAPAP